MRYFDHLVGPQRSDRPAPPQSQVSASVVATTTGNITDPLRTATSTVGGYFSDYDSRGMLKYVLVQAENQSAAVELGGMRDALFVQHVDRDLVDYVPLTRRVISNGARVLMSGYNDGAGWSQQTKDLHAGWFTAEGRVTGTFGGGTRGVSGVLGEAIQYGAGVATNEFGAFNPLVANEQSAQLASLIAILSGKKAAADGSHTAVGLTVNNLGKSATAGIMINSTGTDGDNGQYQYLLYAGAATVNTAAIVMPLSATTIEGTMIVYDSGDYSFFDRAGNSFVWAIAGGVNRFQGDAGNFFPSTNGGMALGTAASSWNALFLTQTGVINFGNGDVLLTGAANLLSLTGGNFDVTGLVQTDTFRIDQAASTVGTGAKTISNAADSSTNFGKYFSFSLNGTTVFVPCGTVAPT